MALRPGYRWEYGQVLPVRPGDGDGHALRTSGEVAAWFAGFKAGEEAPPVPAWLARLWNRFVAKRA